MGENLRSRGPRASRKLEESEEKYRHLIEDISDGYAVLQGGKIAIANRRCAEISGYPLEEFIGQPPTKFVPPKVLEQALELFRSSICGEQAPQRYETVLSHQDGTKVPVEVILRDIIYEGSPAVSAIFRDISERKRVEGEILRRSRQLEAVNAIAATVSQTLDLDQLLDIALVKVLEVINADVGAIYLVDREQNEVVLKAHQGLSEEFTWEVSRLQLEEEVGRAMAWKEPIFQPDKLLSQANLARLMAAMEREGLQSPAVAGLWCRGIFYGAMPIATRHYRELSAEDIDLLSAISNQLALAIENASLYRDTEDKAERMAVTAELTKIIGSRLDIEEVFDAFAAGVRKLVDAAQIGIDIVEVDKVRVFAVSSEADGEIKAGGFLPLMGSATEWVWKNKRSIVEADLAQRRQFASDEIYFKGGVRSAIHIPLFSKGEVFGTFKLLSCRPHAYREREVEILEELAGQIAVAIENDRLYQETKERAEQIAMTSELTRLIGSSLDIKEVYQAFTAQLKNIVDFDRASIALVEGENLRLLAVSSDKGTKLGGGAVVPLEDSATAWVVANNRANIERDFTQVRQFPTGEILYKEGMRSAIHIPLFSKGKAIGTFNLTSRHPNAYSEREQQILWELAGHIAIAIENDRLYQEVKERKEELETAYDQLMFSATALERGKQELEDAYLQIARTLVLTLEARDPYTRGHSERVAQLARQIAFEMGFSQEEIKKIESAARLHDLGKIGIPDGILLKPSAITPSERAEIQLHPTKTVELLRFLGFMDGVLPIIEGHHERYNGGGYPSGLRGEEAPLGARILAVADAYDAMTSDRPYRAAMTSEEAIETLKQGAGTQWDPAVVEAFLRAFCK